MFAGLYGWAPVSHSLVCRALHGGPAASVVLSGDEAVPCGRERVHMGPTPRLSFPGHRPVCSPPHKKNNAPFQFFELNSEICPPLKEDPPLGFSGKSKMDHPKTVRMIQKQPTCPTYMPPQPNGWWESTPTHLHPCVLMGGSPTPPMPFHFPKGGHF